MEKLEGFTLAELIALRIAVAELRDQDITTNNKHVSWEKILTKIDRALSKRTNNYKL